MDLTQREGKYDTPPWAPKTLGVEFSGWVEGLGAGDMGDFKIGDEVFGLAYGVKSAKYITGETDQIVGAYAEYVASATKMLIHKPKEISWTIAAGIPEVYFSQAFAVEL
jgi:NADPH2:quinone reductase